jgi:UDP-glucuronate decarboxylase
MSEFYRIRNTIKYPTSLIVNAASNLGLELATSLLEQGGYVVLIDVLTDQNLERIFNKLGQHGLFTVLDYAAVPHLEEDLRRLDYIFYLQHEYRELTTNITTQDFLRYSNYLDSTLQLATRFEAKYLLTTSISAHQHYLAAAPDADMQFGRASYKPSTYNHMELQRYAENLTLEYVNNANINGRVLRLGEVIGDGIDFLKANVFNKMVLAAAASQPITVPGDGLESEWYVNVLDAAYAIVKAQFTKDTSGNIYSVSYETPLTAISIAYKLQDLEPTAKEIKFDINAAVTPPLQLYRPAPSLGQIGWKPNVNIEQSLKDSLAAAKHFLLTAADADLEKQLGKQSNLLRRLRELVSSAKETIPEVEVSGGPVARLIAQRQQQEAHRQQSVSQANNYIRQRRHKRELNFGQKLDNAVWSVISWIGDRFSFLKATSPFEFFAYIIILVIGVFLYFTLISPLAVITRNSVVAVDEINRLQQSLAQNQYAIVNSSSARMATALSENTAAINQLEGVFNLLAAKQMHQSLQAKTQALAEIADSSAKLAAGLAGVDSYLAAYQNNLSFRPVADNMLNLTIGSSYDMSNISKLDPAVVEAMRTRIDRLKATASGQLIGWPDVVNDHYQTLTQNILQAASRTYSSVDISEHVNDVLANGSTRTYFIALLDNARPMPLGGDITAYALLTIKDGAIINAQVQPFSSVSPATTSLPAYLQAQINLTRWETATTFNLADLAYLTDINDFSAAIKSEWKRRNSVDIDVVMTLNLTAAAEWVSLFPNLDIEQQPVNAENLLRSIQLLQTNNDTIVRRHDIQAQLLAKLLEATSTNLRAEFYDLIQLTSKHYQSKNIQIANNNLSINKLLISTTQNADLILTPYLIADARTINPDRFPALTMVQIVDINERLSFIGRSYYLKFPSTTSIDYVAICTNAAVINFSFVNLPTTRSKTQRQGDKTCYMANVVNEIDINSLWNSAPIDINPASEYNMTLGVGKPSGIDITADIELNFSPVIQVLSISPVLDVVNNKTAAKLPLLTDTLVQLGLKYKNGEETN